MTEVGEWWNVTATPVDSYGLNGTILRSNNVTIRARDVTTTQVDPLNAWVLNDTIKFECNASSGITLVNATLWTNSSGNVWAQNGSSVSISGTYAEFEFNRSGFNTDGLSFVWACQACNIEGGCSYSANRTITIDLTKPGINFTDPTPATNIRNTTFYNWAYVNVSTTDASNRSAFVDYNRSLVGWWRFENNTNDSSTYATTTSCSATACPQTWTGPRGKSYYFDGIDDALTVPYASNLKLGNTGTIAFWYQPKSTATGTHALVAYGNGAEYFTGYLLNQYGTSLLVYWMAGGAAFSYTNAFTNGTWQHFVLVNNNGAMTLYKNGAPVASGSSGGTITADYTTNIGGESAYGAWFTDGGMDEVTIWNRALSADEINATYQAQLRNFSSNFTGLPSGRVNYTASVVDMAGNLNSTEYRNYSVNWLPNVSNMVISSSSGTNYTNENISITYTTQDGDSDYVKNITNWYLNGTSIAVLNMPFESNTQLNMSNWTKDYSSMNNHGTVTGATWNSTGGYDGRGAYGFDGNDDYVNIGTQTSLQTPEITVIAWMKLISPSGYDAIYGSAGSGGGGVVYHLLYYNDATSEITWQIRDSLSNTVVLTSVTTENVWHFVAASINRQNMTLYVDGNQVDKDSTPAGTTTAGLNTKIGVGDSLAHYFNGIIDDVRIFNRTLTADQILLLYRNQTDKIHFNETTVGENWSACVTPNDGLEDGSTVCSANLTIRSAGIVPLDVDPLNSWVLNDTIKFECNASSGVSLVNATLWHNYSNSWTSNGSTTISGTYADFEFNRSGFSTEKTFVWGCQACTVDECNFSQNRTLTIDLTNPGINFTLPTPVTNIRNTTFYNWLYVNTSTADASNRSAFTDFNRSLVGWWRFENNTNDSSTYLNNGSCSGTGCPETWTGARGKAYRFDGVNDKVTATNSSSLQIATTLTVSAWFKMDSLVHYGCVVGKTPDGAWSKGWGVYWANDNNIHFWVNGYTTRYVILPLSDTSTWHHVTGTYNGTTIGLYLDGVYAQSNYVGTIDTNGNLEIGSDCAGGGAYFKGSVDDVMVWNRALSVQEVNATYQNQIERLFRNFTGLPSGGPWNYTAKVVDMAGNLNQTEYRNYSVNWLPNVSGMSISSSAGTNYTNENISISYTTDDGDSDARKNITNWYVNGNSIAVLNMPFESNTQLNMSSWTKDYSGRNNHGSVSGATWNSTGGYDSRGAYVFDGNDDYINITDVTAAAKTISAWVKPYSYGETYMAIVGGYYMQLVNSGNIARFNGTAYSYSSTTVPQNGWSHIAITCDSGTNQLKFYINGTLSNTVSSVCTTSASATSIGTYTQGCITPGCYRFNGSIDEVMIINRTLTADQIMLLYRNQSDKIHFNETTVGENWSACVTPNDGFEDGSMVCSANLTIRSAGVVTTQVDPLDAWVLNDTIKFECNASSSVALTSAELWTNSSGSQWLQNGSSVSLSGTYAEFEFNRSGFVNGTTFVWGCKACTAEECAFSTNRTLTIDLTKPGINFTLPTPVTNIRNTTFYNWLYVNTSTGDASNMSAFTDFNRSLVGWWRFENNTNDSSTYSNSGSCTAGTTCPETWTGPRGKAYNFDGINDYVSANGNSNLKLTNYATISAWIRPNSYSTSRQVILAKSSGAWVDGYVMILEPISSGSVITGYLNLNTTSWAAAVDYTPPTINVWTHYLYTWDGDKIRMWRNGLEVSPADVTNGQTITTSNEDLSIGRVGGPQNNQWFNGSIDEVLLWNRVLSTDEINATYQAQLRNFSSNFTGLPSGKVNYTASVVDMAGNYNTTGYRNYSVNWLPNVSGMSISSSSGTNDTNENISITYTTDDGDLDTRKNVTNWYVNGNSIAVLNMPFESNTQLNMSTWTKDYSGYGAHGTVTSATWNLTGGYDGRGAYQFNGSAGVYISVPETANNLDLNTSFTLSAWIKATSGTGTYSGIMGRFVGGNYLFDWITTYGQPRLTLRTLAGASQIDATCTLCSDSRDNNWHFVAVTVNSTGTTSTVQAYENGVAKDTQTGTWTPGDSSANLAIGDRGFSSVPFNGSIDEVRVYNRTLTADEILLLYRNQTDKIHFHDTIVGENWSACVTPNDGFEDGTQVCSVNLTIRSAGITALQVDPLNAWVLNDSIKFECNAST
ncbi:LamG domain-containing protein, partial [archaeon]|nr:LamG domain-containing protein [archaeon]